MQALAKIQKQMEKVKEDTTLPPDKAYQQVGARYKPCRSLHVIFAPPSLRRGQNRPIADLRRFWHLLQWNHDCANVIETE